MNLKYFYQIFPRYNFFIFFFTFYRYFYIIKRRFFLFFPSYLYSLLDCFVYVSYTLYICPPREGSFRPKEALHRRPPLIDMT